MITRKSASPNYKQYLRFIFSLISITPPPPPPLPSQCCDVYRLESANSPVIKFGFQIHKEFIHESTSKHKRLAGWKLSGAHKDSWSTSIFSPSKNFPTYFKPPSPHKYRWHFLDTLFHDIKDKMMFCLKWLNETPQAKCTQSKIQVSQEKLLYSRSLTNENSSSCTLHL